MILPATAVVPTKDRPVALARTLESLAAQDVLPAELIVVDGSAGDESRVVVERWQKKHAPQCIVLWQRADRLGAATQRNQGVAAATQPFIWFFDDDIRFEPECAVRLWRAMETDSRLGGVNAMIINERYRPPGRVSRTLFTVLHGRNESTFAGRIIGPAVNLLPEDRDDLPEVVDTDWLNSGCTLYRRCALPTPPFDSIFTGYSMMEDVTLSLRVGRTWRLANARTARIFHDTQPGLHKADPGAIAAMELINRHYVMTEVLGRRRWNDYLRLLAWEVFQTASCAARPASRRSLTAQCRGKWAAIRRISSRTKYN